MNHFLEENRILLELLFQKEMDEHLLKDDVKDKYYTLMRLGLNLPIQHTAQTERLWPPPRSETPLLLTIMSRLL